MNEEEKDHHDKMIKGLNMILEDTDILRKKSSWANEHIDYINTNTRNMYFTINQMNEQIQSILRSLNDLKKDIDLLKKVR